MESEIERVSSEGIFVSRNDVYGLNIRETLSIGKVSIKSTNNPNYSRYYEGMCCSSGIRTRVVEGIGELTPPR
jgi:hypothetical protein